MNDYWLDIWKNKNIAFHLSTVNPFLEKYWPQLAIEKDSNVLVPLCGKSLDLLWLAQSGYHVVGVELSEIACEEFFKENEMDYKVEVIPNFKRYYNSQIEIYCGDFFVFSRKIFPNIHAVYDRAALIALPPDLRKAYAKHLFQLVEKNSQMLLIALDSTDAVQGPPFPVSAKEVESLFARFFQINELASFKETDVSFQLQGKGYKEYSNVIYQLIRLSD